MQNLSLFHETFNLRKLSSYLLNIQVSEEKLFYTINDAVRNQCIAVVSTEFENAREPIIDKFQNIVKNDVYLNKHYKTVNFLFVSEKITLVPADFFDKKYVKDYFKFNHFISPDEEVHFAYIEEIKAYLLYAFPAVLINFLVNHFPEIRFFHTAFPFIKNIHRIDSQFSDVFETVGINFFENSFEIFIVKKQKPILYNNFKFNTDEDAVFYIISILKKLSINLNRVRIFLQGSISEKSNIYKHLIKFLPQTGFVNKIDFLFSFKNTNTHQFVNILQKI